MNRTLQVGDRAFDNSVCVVDEDRLCYQVDSFSKGVHGIRTISKALLNEWVLAVGQHPNFSAQELRDLLSGKTVIDKFEYGYAATLKKMADMVHGNVEVVRARVDYSTEFCKWFAENRGKGKDTTAKKYISYFKTLTDEYQEPTNSYWHGLYRVIYSADAEKDVIEIGESEEFDRIYGGIVTALEKKVKGVRMTDEGFQRAIDWFWKPEVKSHTCVTSALNAYSDYLKWRETQQKKKGVSVSKTDMLSLALKLFAVRRNERTGLSSWKSYDEWTHRVRDVFCKVNEGLINEKEFNYEKFIREFSVSEQTINNYFSKHSTDERKAVLKFLREQKVSPRAASWYIDEENRPRVNGKKVNGMGAVMALYFMSELLPEEFAAWSDRIWEGLRNVGLHNGDNPKMVTIENYEECRSKQQQIVARMKELGIGKASDDDTAPDYRTVNEFLWFISEKKNKDLLKEEVMKKEFKDAPQKAKSGTRKLSDAVKDDDMLQRLMAALRTKPFAILAGHSGTGKSQMVRKLAYMTCADEGLMDEAATSNAPGNYCMIQVRPNWHDSTDLLGYYSELREKYRTTPFVQFVCKAYAYPEIPFFVCLDEMNLAPVEQYFAEYLSAIESMTEKDGQFLTDPLIPGKYAADDIMEDDAIRFTESKAWYEAHGLTLPKNLFVVGTVNMDDTTCQFSRKVLDRAMTIMMDKVDFKDMQDTSKCAPPSKDDLLDVVDIKKFREGKLRADPLSNGQVALLNSIDGVLRKTPFAVAYRYANEYALYEDSLSALTGKPKDGALDTEAMDHCVLMKVLPRIHGENRAVERIFKGNDSQGEKGLMSILTSPGTLSGAKMQEILDRKQTYLSFWP